MGLAFFDVSKYCVFTFDLDSQVTAFCFVYLRPKKVRTIMNTKCFIGQTFEFLET